MGFRFSRRLRIFPGLTLNLGKTGVSVSLGGKGAHVTLEPKGTRTTVGLPGTGMSWTNYQPHRWSKAAPLPAIPKVEKLTDTLIREGRRAADGIARVMQDPELIAAEHNELRACRDQVEQYIKIAETETMQVEEVASLIVKVGDVGVQFADIIDRVRGRMALSQ